MPPSAERTMSSLQEEQQSISSGGVRSIMIDENGSKPGLEQQQQQKHRKLLSFSEDVTVHEIEGTEDMTSKEIKSVWYNRDEYYKIRHTYEKIIDKMEKYSGSGSGGKILDETKYCTVGLLRMTQHEEGKCNSRRKHAWRAIQQEQQLQKEEGICDPQRIAEVYTETNSATSCQMLATMSAIRLANDVAKYQSEPTTAASSNDDGSFSSSTKGSSKTSSKRRISQMFKIKRISSSSQRGF